jgi:2,4-dienoyl-CoA reductase (NADPH2)
MGSEGYFLNQFLVTHTNRRTDRWGGSYENRMRLPVEVVRRVRAAVGRDFIVIYRISLIDLVPDGSTWDEVVRWRRPSRRRGPRSSTPASAGTRRGCRPSPPRCPGGPSPG